MKEPKKIDMDLVKSQETRRILDRIIGFKLSKLLQNKIQSKSAGRVQSVALRLIVERENEIRKFKPEEYWSIHGDITKGRKTFTADLAKVDGKKNRKSATRKRHRPFSRMQARPLPFLRSRPAAAARGRSCLSRHPPCSRKPVPNSGSVPGKRCPWHRSCMKESTWEITQKV